MIYCNRNTPENLITDFSQLQTYEHTLYYKYY